MQYKSAEGDHSSNGCCDRAELPGDLLLPSPSAEPFDTGPFAVIVSTETDESLPGALLKEAEAAPLLAESEFLPMKD